MLVVAESDGDRYLVARWNPDGPPTSLDVLKSRYDRQQRLERRRQRVQKYLSYAPRAMLLLLAGVAIVLIGLGRAVGFLLIVLSWGMAYIIVQKGL